MFTHLIYDSFSHTFNKLEQKMSVVPNTGQEIRTKKH